MKNHIEIKNKNDSKIENLKKSFLYNDAKINITNLKNEYEKKFFKQKHEKLKKKRIFGKNWTFYQKWNKKCYENYEL